MSNLIRTTSLFLNDPSINADKCYFVYLRQEGDGFTVSFSYGRRGAALASGTKTATPVSRQAAEKIEDKLIKEKKSKGYVEDASGQRVIGTASGEASGHMPQLLNAIDEGEVQRLIDDAAVAMQPKMDGERRMLLCDGETVRGINRKGEFVAVPEAWKTMATVLGSPVLIDGEAIGDTLHAFDILVDVDDLRRAGFGERYQRLAGVLSAAKTLGFLRLVPLAATRDSKLAMLEDEKAKHGEGVVFKSIDAPYTAGRPNSGGPALKLKFWESATCIAGEMNGTKRSVAIHLIGEREELVEVGNVTVPANAALPAKGELIEVRYLYRAGLNGSLFQPTYLGRRTDMERSEARIEQIRRIKQGQAANELDDSIAA